MPAQSYPPLKQVNGAMLESLPIGTHVVIFGKVLQQHDGIVTIETTDNKTVYITEVYDVCELSHVLVMGMNQGINQGNMRVKFQSWTQFADTVDAQNYNELVKILSHPRIALY